MNKDIHAYIYIYIYLHIDGHVYTHIHIHIYTYIHIYIMCLSIDMLVNTPTCRTASKHSLRSPRLFSGAAAFTAATGDAFDGTSSRSGS